ncbi:hypothetical protein D2L64_21080 [Micromonospora radicis]|uniref:Uncharacterized protein n=1 Tax=Micromonospora radicis TaxID=1894971 RepID=A0A418MQM9_9ACTN|nr:hypothetical protein D2L64_21080 [Micromonospora radicis]
MRRPSTDQERPRPHPPHAGSNINRSDPGAGRTGACTGAEVVRRRSDHHEEVSMAKKARKKKARKKSAANHGKRPNS